MRSLHFLGHWLATTAKKRLIETPNLEGEEVVKRIDTNIEIFEHWHYEKNSYTEMKLDLPRMRHGRIAKMVGCGRRVGRPANHQVGVGRMSRHCCGRRWPRSEGRSLVGMVRSSHPFPPFEIALLKHFDIIVLRICKNQNDNSVEEEEEIIKINGLRLAFISATEL